MKCSRKGGGKNYNRPETSGDASPSAEASPPVEATPAPAAEGGEQRPPFQPSKGGGKGGGKARGKGFKGDDGKGGKGKGGKGRGFQPQGGSLNQGASPTEGSPAPSPAPGPAEDPRPAPPPQAPNSGSSFPGMPGGFMQQPMAGCMACPMPFFDMSQVSMYPGYMGGCMPYPMPYNVNPDMMPCMGNTAPNSEQRTEQINKAKTQIEYYFSEENLIKDVFLRQNIMDTQGWVPLNRLLEFPQLAKTCRTDMSILVDAILQSTSLETLNIAACLPTLGIKSPNMVALGAPKKFMRTVTPFVRRPSTVSPMPRSSGKKRQQGKAETPLSRVQRCLD
ncbi:Lupus La protein-like A [Symbiodinium microadriaticum]|uniref:Lupus La protein-like A n=1 Tax=Symbiodinium microadriaticum TaxID=2951 RepID=A0A1Q9CDX5_SYMMI|nr:Lupus La protein-like A [Symbiodinium microadriaticum]